MVQTDPMVQHEILTNPMETKKFREELVKKLLSKEKGRLFGDELDAVVVNFCDEIFSEFLHMEYGGPGTLLASLSPI